MVAVLNSALAQIATQWEALTPPDRATVRYHEADGRRRMLGGTAGDRVFEFDLPVREEISGQAGPAYTTITWRVTAQIQLSQAGRSGQAMRAAVATEGNLLSRNVERTSSWPVGVIEVITGPAVPEITDRGDALISIEFQITTFETDG